MLGFLLALATLNKMRELSLIVLVKILIMYKIIGIILEIFLKIRISIISSRNSWFQKRILIWEMAFDLKLRGNG